MTDEKKSDKKSNVYTLSGKSVQLETDEEQFTWDVCLSDMQEHLVNANINDKQVSNVVVIGQLEDGTMTLLLQHISSCITAIGLLERAKLDIYNAYLNDSDIMYSTEDDD